MDVSQASLIVEMGAIYLSQQIISISCFFCFLWAGNGCLAAQELMLIL